jgi:hypothetical protein
MKFRTVFLVCIALLVILTCPRISNIYAAEEGEDYNVLEDDDVENEDVIRVPADTTFMSPEIFSFKVPKKLDGPLGQLQGLVDNIIANVAAYVLSKSRKSKYPETI